MEVKISASTKSLKIRETTGLIYLQYTGSSEDVTLLQDKAGLKNQNLLLYPIRKMGLQNKQPP